MCCVLCAAGSQALRQLSSPGKSGSMFLLSGEFYCVASGSACEFVPPSGVGMTGSRTPWRLHVISEESGVVGVGYAHGYLHALLMLMCMHPSGVAFLAGRHALA